MSEIEYKIYFQYGDEEDYVIIPGDNIEEIRQNWRKWAESRGLDPKKCYRGSEKIKGDE